MKIRPRRTVYRHQNYLMRSYAETRWAQIMDALGISWTYEQGAVTTEHGMYLPDFYLKNACVTLEVKGAAPSFIEVEKAQDASIQLGTPVVIAYGDPATHGLSIINAYLMVVYGNKRVGFTLNELAEQVRTHDKGSAWTKLMKVCVKHKYNPVRDFREALDEVLIGGGSETNSYRREVAADENTRRASKDAGSSPIELVLSHLSKRIVSRARGKTA